MLIGFLMDNGPCMRLMFILAIALLGSPVTFFFFKTMFHLCKWNNNQMQSMIWWLACLHQYVDFGSFAWPGMLDGQPRHTSVCSALDLLCGRHIGKLSFWKTFFKTYQHICRTPYFWAILCTIIFLYSSWMFTKLELHTIAFGDNLWMMHHSRDAPIYRI